VLNAKLQLGQTNWTVESDVTVARFAVSSGDILDGFLTTLGIRFFFASSVAVWMRPICEVMVKLLSDKSRGESWADGLLVSGDSWDWLYCFLGCKNRWDGDKRRSSQSMVRSVRPSFCLSSLRSS